MYTDILDINLLEKFNAILFSEIELIKPMFIKMNKKKFQSIQKVKEKKNLFLKQTAIYLSIQV